MDKNELRERLAKLAHEQWSGWMQYLFEKSTLNDDGTATIPKWAVDRWTRQIGTKYDDLPQEEKDSDRAEADRVIEILKVALSQNDNFQEFVFDKVTAIYDLLLLHARSSNDR